MATANPEWITQRGGELRASKDGSSWTVYLRGEPQYLLIPVPAGGKFACRISQTNNGKRLDDASKFDSQESALAGGLEQLRETLGW